MARKRRTAKTTLTVVLLLLAIGHWQVNVADPRPTGRLTKSVEPSSALSTDRPDPAPLTSSVASPRSDTARHSAELEVLVRDERGDPVPGVPVSLIPPTKEKVENTWRRLLRGGSLVHADDFEAEVEELHGSPLQALAVTDESGVARWHDLPGDYPYRYFVHRDVASVDPRNEFPETPFVESGDRVTLRKRAFMPASISAEFYLEGGTCQRFVAAIWHRTGVSGCFLTPPEVDLQQGTLYEVSQGRLIALRTVALADNGTFHIEGLEPGARRQLQFVAISHDDENRRVLDLAQVSFECVEGRSTDLGLIAPLPAEVVHGSIDLAGPIETVPGPVALRIHEATRTREGVHNLVLLPFEGRETSIPVILRGLSFDNTLLNAEVAAESTESDVRFGVARAHILDRSPFRLSIPVTRTAEITVVVEAPLGGFHGIVRLDSDRGREHSRPCYVDETNRLARQRFTVELGREYRTAVHTTHAMNSEEVSYFAEKLHRFTAAGEVLTLNLVEATTVEVQSLAEPDGDILTLEIAGLGDDFTLPTYIDTRARQDRWVFYGVPPHRAFSFSGSRARFETGYRGSRSVLLDVDLLAGRDD